MQHWYNNGIVEKRLDSCPDGWIMGRLAFSEDHKEKCRQNGRGHVPWNKGLTKEQDDRLALSEETKHKISNSTLGVKKSEQHRKHISEAKVGMPIPEAVKEKISNTLTGRTMPKEQVQHSIDAKRANGTLNTSSCELLWGSILQNIGDVLHEYKSNNYAYNCDFFLPKVELYIELNFHPSHGIKPFIDDTDDKSWLDQVRSRQKLYTSSTGKVKKNLYYKFEEVAVHRDPAKRTLAINNKLNYLNVYNNYFELFIDGNIVFSEWCNNDLNAYSELRINNILAIVQSFFIV